MKAYIISFFCLLLLLSAVAWAQQPGAASTGKYIPLLHGKRVGVVMNQTSWVGDSLLVDVLLARGVRVQKIFVPEHGFRGQVDAGAHVDNSRDSATGLPVISLYGKHKEPTAEDLADVDVLVYDLQDVGVRFYTYISTLEYCMQACAQYHKRLIVLDRPDPNGWYVDGPVLEVENRSFVGMQPVPVVYGMTPGEYAKMLKGESGGKGAAGTGSGQKEKSEKVHGSEGVKEDVLLRRLDIVVIPCTGYTHCMRYALPVAPSPNLRTMAAVYAYPSLCLFEGTQVSVGRGTDKPFMQYGCPEFAGKFDYSFVPVSMQGALHPPYEGKQCYGELVGTDTAEVLQKTEGRFSIGWLIKAYNAYPDKDKFFTPFFAKLCGTEELEKQIKVGESEAAIRASWQPGIEAFKKIRKKYLLYK